MATPPLTSSPGMLTRGARRQHDDIIPPSSPPPFLRRTSLKRTASASSSIDPDSPSARPTKRRAVRAGLRRTNSISSISQPEIGDENVRPTTTSSKFPATPPRILKRTPSLLPAIDFQPSPPRPSRPENSDELSEKYRRPLEEEIEQQPLLKKQAQYPTPAPTSEMGIPTSPPLKAASRRDSTPVTFGRSANKCTYLLSKSHLVSRIHFKVCYLGLGLRKQVEIHCVGFNGAKVHCRGDMWELRYGEIFWSESGADIMLEIDDARVVIRWPSDSLSPTSPLSPVTRPVVLDARNFPYPAGYDVASETRRDPWPTEGVDAFTGLGSDPVIKLNKPSPRSGLIGADALVEPAPLRLSREPWACAPDSPCPLPKNRRLLPVSPINPFASMTSQATTFTLYEDEDDNANLVSDPAIDIILEDEDEHGILRESEKPEGLNTEVELDDDDDDEEDDEEEVGFAEEDSENLDSVAHTTTPKKAYKLKHKLDESVKQDPLSPKSKQSIMKHLTNQLAFSRLASTPLSNLFKSLPGAVMDKVPIGFVQALLTSVACIGEIKREGKDASGRPLECEYYYIGDLDDDEDRKALVGTLSKPSLRACRKTHKQYFWKKPKV
ncbi:hypothetical protein ABW20_dc0107572 [Dactylellina cionopaga]|nr:hypothetical protein ABW20_dc0107572 [Dactylellina cionopaga]